MRNDATRRLARGALLLALCCALSMAESLLAGWVGLPPGVKPGLANVVVMYALFFLGWRQAAALWLLKAAFVLLTRGVLAGALSAAGGGMALAALWLVGRRRQNSWTLVSVCGALAHNAGQTALLCAVLHSAAPLWYLPVLTLAAVGCGTLSALVLHRLLQSGVQRLTAAEKTDAAPRRPDRRG